jgi:hypothetical protein
MRFARALAILAVAASVSATAAIPVKMSYQGYLTDSTDTPVTGTVSMTLKLYDQATNGNLLWTETQSVNVANGIYSVILGNSIPLDETLFNGQRYLAVAIGADVDLAPRTPLTSAPYAFVAKALDGTVGGGQISGTVGVGNGGTGLSSITTGGLLYGQGSGTPGVTSAGSVGQVLTATAGGVPQWSNSVAAGLAISHPSLVTVQGVTFNAGSVELAGGRTISVGGVQVVGSQQAAVASAVNATGVDLNGTAVVTVAEFNAVVAKLNDALDRLRAHGLIAP